MGKLFGWNGKVFLSGTLASPADALADNAAISTATWVEMPTVKSATINAPGDTKDVTTRASAANGFKAYAIVISDADVTLNFYADESDVGLVSLRTAYFAKAELGMAFMDGDMTTGSNGLAGNWIISDYKNGQPIEDMMTVDVTFRPGPSGVLENYTKT